MRRIAFAGASGTGKTTLAERIAADLCLPICPVGSRPVSAAMGFASPYDVDKAGRRAEFQRRLIAEKAAWERENPAFVTDRTTLDNLAYTMLHDVHSVDAELLAAVMSGVDRYTHVIYCPVEAFCNTAGDGARIAELTYQRLYDAALFGLLSMYRPRHFNLLVRDLHARHSIVSAIASATTD